MHYWGCRQAPDEARELSDEERDCLLADAKNKIAAIDGKYGILSLCCNKENFLLWAHYADEHRGAVVELDIGDPVFAGAYEKKGGAEERGAIDYVKERPKLPLDDAILMEHFFSKSPHWAYESEYRVVRDLAYADKVIAVENGHDVCLFRLPPTCLRSLTFGVRFERKRSSALARRMAKSQQLQHIALEQTKLDPQRFALSFEAI